MRTIKMQMTWADAVEVYMMALENGSDNAKDSAKSELRRLARMVDETSHT